MFSWMATFFILALLARMIAAYGKRIARYGAKCTEFAVGVLKDVRVEARSDTSNITYVVEYPYGDKSVTVNVPELHTEDFSQDTPVGSEIPVWYRPGYPEQVVLADKQGMEKTRAVWERSARRWNMMLAVLFAACVVSWFV